MVIVTEGFKKCFFLTILNFFKRKISLNYIQNIAFLRKLLVNWKTLLLRINLFLAWLNGYGRGLGQAREGWGTL